MRTIKILTSDDEELFSSLIKKKKSSSYILLYYSEWDNWSQRILAKAKKWAENPGDETVYVISSWELPQAFAAFGVTAAPVIVEVRDGAVKVIVEYPKVYEYFTPFSAAEEDSPRHGFDLIDLKP